MSLLRQKRKDPAGYPDYTTPITVIGYTIEALPIEIKAQTLGVVKVDVSTQSLAQLNVNLAASAVTLDVNIAASAVTLGVDIKAQSATLTVAVSGTANVNIADAVVNISALRLMDTGVIKRVWGSAINDVIGLYTVPTGKKFYIYSVDLNSEHYAAGDHYCNVHMYDGTDWYYIIILRGPDAVDHMHQAIGFSICSIPAGWSIRTYANAYTRSYASIVGIEVNA